jgi:hypothetical protein
MREAIGIFEEVLQLDPNSVESEENLKELKESLLSAKVRQNLYTLRLYILYLA